MVGIMTILSLLLLTGYTEDLMSAWDVFNVQQTSAIIRDAAWIWG